MWVLSDETFNPFYNCLNYACTSSLFVLAMARLAYTAVNATDVEEGQGAPDLSHRRPESNRWRKIYCMTIVLVVAFVGLVGYWRSGSTTSTTSPSLSEAATGRPQLADRLGAERTRLVLKLLGVRHSNDAELLKAVRTPAAIAMLCRREREKFFISVSLAISLSLPSCALPLSHFPMSHGLPASFRRRPFAILPLLLSPFSFFFYFASFFLLLLFFFLLLLLLFFLLHPSFVTPSPTQATEGDRRGDQGGGGSFRLTRRPSPAETTPATAFSMSSG